MENLVKGLIHCHSENSRYDSGMSVETLVKRAKELGYEAVSLTDHGTLSGIDDFILAAKAEGIKPIYGVELYVVKDETINRRMHLILIAKDDLGIQGINKIVTESNENIDAHGKPITTPEMLEKYFGEGSEYHGHVFATSACVAGVLASEYFRNLYIFEDIEKIKKKIKEGGDEKSFDKNVEIMNKIDEKIDELTNLKTGLVAKAKKSYKKRENALKKLEGTPEYDAELEALNKEKEETRLAAESVEKVSKDIAKEKTSKRLIKEQIDKYNDVKTANKPHLEKIEKLNKLLISKEETVENIKSAAKFYDTLFGHGFFTIELQYHGYVNETLNNDIEKESMPVLVNIAKELDIPMTVATDAHMPDGSEESIRTRYLMRAIQWATSKTLLSINPGDKELYLKSEEELKKALLNIADEETIDKAIENTYSICGKCEYKLESGEHYPKFNGCRDNLTATEELRKMAEENIPVKFPEGFTNEYRERVEHELNVISKMGYSDYFLIVQDFLAFGRKLGYLSTSSLNYLREHIKEMSLDELNAYVDSKKEKLGLSVGPGRGSAAGSLVAYLIGITNIINPIKYDLLFERFLNEDRVSMPDVDSDFSPEIRDLVVEYCRIRYGRDTVANIMTKGYMAPKGAIRNVARIIGLEKGQPDHYLVLANKIAKLVPGKPGVSFKDCEDLLNETFEEYPDDNKAAKFEKAECREIIKEAKLIEGCFLNYGMHAAGVIIADGHPISDYVALMKDEKSGGMKVQCDMVQAEGEHGLLKFDFLGLRNLNIITKAIRGIKIKTGKDIDVTKLSMDDNVFKNIFASGYTGSVFQFESEGMKSMLKKFKPTCFEDLIALVSLYRPGPMDFIPDYINAKYHPEDIHYLCPQLEPILGKTYGTIVYQEQVMEIFQKLAGYSLSGADNVRRFMSKKKLEKLVKEREAFINGDKDRNIIGCVANGIDEEVANTLFDQMLSFASYAFNKSHAAAYAMVSYITAWLKYYYPAEYMCAVLNTTDDITKLQSVLNDCHEIGITVYAPDVNVSQLGFTVTDDNNIIFGLDSVKGTREGSSIRIISEREENGEYTDFKNFLLRTNPDKATVENLILAGAFDDFSENRAAISYLYSQAQDLIEKITQKEEKIKEKELIPEDQRKKRDITYLENAKNDLKLYKEQFSLLHIIDGPEDRKNKLLREKEVLGLFISSHPLDGYAMPKKFRKISSLTAKDKNVSVMGIIQDVSIKNRKSDGKPMAFFTIEDTTGRIPVCCFTNSYDKYSVLIADNEIVKISGKIMVEEDDSDYADGDPEIKISVDTLEVVERDLEDIIVYIDNIFEYNKTLSELKKDKYIDGSGHKLVVYDNNRGEYRSTKFYVNEGVLDSSKYITKKLEAV